MFLKRRIAACISVTAALAVPVASASAATIPASGSALGSPRCPDNYTGPTNPATGCPPWLMIGATNAWATPMNDLSLGSPSCPANYVGPTNPATGCPPWLMIYASPASGRYGG